MEKRTGSGPNPLDNGYHGDSFISTSAAQTHSPPGGGQTPAHLSLRTRPAFQLKGPMQEKS